MQFLSSSARPLTAAIAALLVALAVLVGAPASLAAAPAGFADEPWRLGGEADAPCAWALPSLGGDGERDEPATALPLPALFPEPPRRLAAPCAAPAGQHCAASGQLTCRTVTGPPGA